jgi:hypothetical protein
MMAAESLASLLSSITDSIEYFSLDTQQIDFDSLSPFVTIMGYKAGLILTRRLLGKHNPGDEELRKLRVMRKFLKMMGHRWLGARQSDPVPSRVILG